MGCDFEKEIKGEFLTDEEWLKHTALDICPGCQKKYMLIKSARLFCPNCGWTGKNGETLICPDCMKEMYEEL
jgi:predicted amidophosphoribosyltransferase